MSDEILERIADYVCHDEIASEVAYQTARVCLGDAMGCALLALNFPECTKLLGPIVKGMENPNGCPVPATPYRLDPILAAWNIGTLIRWLDYNDTWLAAEWGHPSDNLGGILSVAYYREATVKEVLTAMIKAYEIQGVLALTNSFNRMGFDHVILVKVATAAVTTHLLGGKKEQVIDSLSQAFIDAGPLRTYRHGINTGSRKSWAGGDATSRGAQLAFLTMKGEMGYPHAIEEKRWGVNDSLMRGHPLTLERPLGSYVMENILFKVVFPAEFHAQTAVECALDLHDTIKDRLDDIQTIHIDTQESAMRIINKTGELTNPADRDHCLQYMVAVALLHGDLDAKHYEEPYASDPRIHAMREKMILEENGEFSRDYLDPDKRSIANQITIQFKDGKRVGPLRIDYPIGHRRRREEALPLLYDKLRINLSSRLKEKKALSLLELFQNHDKLLSISLRDLFSHFD